MLWHPTTVDDLERALAIDPYSFGDEIVGRERALAAYRELVATRRFLSAVVELPLPSGKSQIAGFGGALFVSDALVRQEVANPKPGLNARIVASLAERTAAVLNHEEIRRANTFDGLNVVITQAAWAPNTLTADRVSRLERLMSEAFYQLVRGYRLLRLVREAGSAAAIEHVKSQQIFATSSGTTGWCFSSRSWRCSLRRFRYALTHWRGATG